MVGLMPLRLLAAAHPTLDKPPRVAVDRLRLGRHHRRGHAVPHRPRRRRRARAGGRRRRHALLRPVEPPSRARPARAHHHRRRAQLPDAGGRQVRRHRLRAVEPVDHRRLEPVHRRLLEAGARPPRRRRRLLPVGAALRDVVEATSRPSCTPSPTVFPYTYVFSAEDLSSDVILVATNHPLALDVHAPAPQLRRRRSWQAELKRGGVESAEDIVAYLLLTPDEIPAFTAGSPLNTDDNALIEFAAPRDLLGSTRTCRSLPGARLRQRVALRPLRSLPRRPRRRRRRWKTELRLARSLLAPRQARRRRALPRAPPSATARRPTTRAAQLAELLGENDDRGPRDPARRQPTRRSRRALGGSIRRSCRREASLAPTT